jgi:hypothetical protein
MVIANWFPDLAPLMGVVFPLRMRARNRWPTARSARLVGRRWARGHLISRTSPVRVPDRSVEVRQARIPARYRTSSSSRVWRGPAAFRVTGRLDELTPCDARSMTDKPRYRLRDNSPALSRRQWWIFGVAVLVAIVGPILLAITGKAPFGGILMGLSALVIVFTVVSALARSPRK